MTHDITRRESGGADTRADDSRQLALLDHGAALDGEVLPPPHPERFAPSEAEMQELAGEVKAACALLEASVRTTFDRAVDLGAVLLKARERLGHGWWLPWLGNHTKLKPGMASMHMLLVRGKEELPARDFQRIKKLGVAAGAAELHRRHREERQAKREEREEKEEACVRIPTPVQRDDDTQEDDPDYGPDCLLSLAECAKIACQEPDVWRFMGTDKWIELREALEQADPALLEREKTDEISLVDFAIEHAKSKVHGGPSTLVGIGDSENFTPEEKTQLGYLTAWGKTKFVAADMMQAMEILRVAVEAVGHNDQGDVELDNIIDTYGEIARRFQRSLYHNKLDLQRDRAQARAGGDAP